MAGWGQAWDVLVERQQTESTRGSMASWASEGKVFGNSTSRKLSGQIVELTGGARNVWQHLTVENLDGVLEEP